MTMVQLGYDLYYETKGKRGAKMRELSHRETLSLSLLLFICNLMLFSMYQMNLVPSLSDPRWTLFMAAYLLLGYIAAALLIRKWHKAGFIFRFFSCVVSSVFGIEVILTVTQIIIIWAVLLSQK